MSTLLVQFLENSLLSKKKHIESDYVRVPESVLIDVLNEYYELRKSTSPSPSNSDLAVYAEVYHEEAIRLASQCAFYIECLHMPDPLYVLAMPPSEFTKLLRRRNNQSSKIDRNDLGRSVRQIMALKPAIVAGVVQLEIAPPPTQSIPTLRTNSNFYDLLPSKLLDFYREKAIARTVVRDETGAGFVLSRLEPCDDVLISFKGHPGKGFGFHPTIQPRDVPLSDREFKEFVDGCINRAAWALQRELDTNLHRCSQLGVKLLSTTPLTSDLFTTDASRDISSTVIEAISQPEVPFFNNLSLDNVIRIRQQDGEAFQQFRYYLEHSLRSLRVIEERDIRTKHAYDILDELTSYRVGEVRAAAQMLQKKLDLRTKVAGAAILTSVMPFALDGTISADQGVLAATAGVSALGLLAHKRLEKDEQLRKMPGFFLWRISDNDI